MSRPFCFVVLVEEGRNFEITGWGDDALEALRDALWSNTTAVTNRFPLGDHVGFKPEDLCIEEIAEIGGAGGYDVSFHPAHCPPLAKAALSARPWAIRVSLPVV